MPVISKNYEPDLTPPSEIGFQTNDVHRFGDRLMFPTQSVVGLLFLCCERVFTLVNKAVLLLLLLVHVTFNANRMCI